MPNGYKKIKETVKSDMFVHPLLAVLCNTIQYFYVNKYHMMQLQCFKSIFYVSWASFLWRHSVRVFPVHYDYVSFSIAVSRVLVRSQHRTNSASPFNSKVVKTLSHCPTLSLFTEWIMPSDGTERLTDETRTIWPEKGRLLCIDLPVKGGGGGWGFASIDL